MPPSFVECFLSSGLREHPSRNAKLSYAAVAKRSQDPRGRGVDQEEARVQGKTEGKRQQVACQNPGASTQMASWQSDIKPSPALRQDFSFFSVSCTLPLEDASIGGAVLFDAGNRETSLN